MQVLKEGSTGADVKVLQEKLQQRGFSPGAADGIFGGGTAAAVIAFQKSEGLVADGIVGPKTAAELGFDAASLPPAPTVAGVTVAVVSKMFPSTPLGPINRNLPGVLAALQQKNLTAIPMVLCALATIRAETEGFEPISEYQSRYNTSPGGHPFDLYDNRKDLGNRGQPDGAAFKGRGFVQLTGRSNYEAFGPVVGVPDLAANPDQANDPVIAARILAAFMAAKAGRIADALAVGDLATARRCVNGGINGLDRFTSAYEIGTALVH